MHEKINDKKGKQKKADAAFIVAACNSAAEMAEEIIRLREALAKYADKDNWGKYERIDNYFIWIYSTRKGWEIAEAALTEGSEK